MSINWGLLGQQDPRQSAVMGGFAQGMGIANTMQKNKYMKEEEERNKLLHKQKMATLESEKGKYDFEVSSKEAGQASVEEYLENPTPKTRLKMRMLNPDNTKAIDAAMKELTDEERTAARNSWLPVISAQKHGNKELAIEQATKNGNALLVSPNPREQQLGQKLLDHAELMKKEGGFEASRDEALLQIGFGDEEGFSKLYGLAEEGDTAKVEREHKRAITKQITEQTKHLPQKVQNETTKALADLKNAEREAMSSINTDADKKIINETSVRASEALARKNKAAGFLSRVGALGTSGGVGNVGVAQLKKWMGMKPTDQQLLRDEIDRFIVDEVLTRLPPGSASDSDVQLIQSRFPKPGARQEEYAAFFNSMTRAVEKSRNYEMAKLSYLSQNHAHMGNAVKDIIIDLPDGSKLEIPKNSNLDTVWANRAPSTEKPKGGTDKPNQEPDFTKNFTAAEKTAWEKATPRQKELLKQKKGWK